MNHCISNTTVISNFSLVDRLDLLESLFTIVYITPEVQEEVIRGLQEGYNFLKNTLNQIKVRSGWLRLVNFETDSEQESYYQFCNKLHTGEASCLAIAKHRNWLLLTDDYAARKIAKINHIEISGTLGVLVSSVKRQIIEVGKADDLLAKMIRGNYRSPFANISEFIKQLSTDKS